MNIKKEIMITSSIYLCSISSIVIYNINNYNKIKKERLISILENIYIYK